MSDWEIHFSFGKGKGVVQKFHGKYLAKKEVLNQLCFGKGRVEKVFRITGSDRVEIDRSRFIDSCK